MKRGEVWWANLPPPIGRRTVLLLSRDRAYQVRSAVTVAEITRTIRQIPVEVVLDQSDGMPTRCAANLDTILTVPKTLLEAQITTLSASKMQLAEKAIKFALNLPKGWDKICYPFQTHSSLSLNMGKNQNVQVIQSHPLKALSRL